MQDELRRQYVEALPERLKQLRTLAAGLLKGDQSAIEGIRVLAHSLHGSGATFGLPAISDAARRVEHAAPAELLKATPAVPKRHDNKRQDTRVHTLEVSNLCKSFGKLKAVDKVSFTVRPGEIFGLIGRNGAGKTTTIRMMMNVFGPDSGEIRYGGKRVGEDFRRIVSYLPEERGLYRKMKVIDLLHFFLEIRGIKPESASGRLDDYLRRFSLDERRQARLEDLSKGNQQKVQFIAAVLSDPEVLVLDEPFSGLDPVNTALLKDMVLELKQAGKVIIFSTHLMDVAERMCDSIALIHKGQLKLNGPLARIKEQYSQRNISLVHEGEVGFLRESPLVEEVHAYGNTTGIRVTGPEAVQPLLELLVQRGVRIKKFDANDISLQEIFLGIAGDEQTDASAAPIAAVAP